jgi:ribosomal protein S18 acetylase RimI-like enzyme
MAAASAAVGLEIRPAGLADLEPIDRLLIETFGRGADSALGGVPQEVQLQLRRDLRRLTPDPTDGLLVATDGAAIAGVVALERAETSGRLGAAVLPVLRRLGPLGALRFFLAALATGYRPARGEAYLSCLAVAPSHRRRGVAERLLRSAELEAGRHGKTLLSGFVAPTNHASLALCQKLGFHPGRPAGPRWRRPVSRRGFIYLRKPLP